MRVALKYGAVLIGIYLVTYYYTGAGTLTNDAFRGITGTVQALQARSGTGAGAYPTASGAPSGG